VCVCVFEFREPISNTGNGRSEKRAKNVKVDRTVQESSLLFCFSSLFLPQEGDLFMFWLSSVFS
jgi:hypothetical protein